MRRGLSTLLTVLIKQSQRIGSGCVAGALIAALIHLLTRDFAFAPYLKRISGILYQPKTFDGPKAYIVELVILALGVGVLVIRPLLPWCMRYIRSWRAGMASLTGPVTALAVVVISNQPWTGIAIRISVGLTALVGILMLEGWRQRAQRHPRPLPPVAIHRKEIVTEHAWTEKATDDPITSWSQDILDRTAIVEMLIDHIFQLQTPIIALNGNFGDGKTSVLNLLRATIKGQAIIVPFSAWLPGSESSLALDLFRDIARECRAYIYVPQLRRRMSAYARVVTGSVSYARGLRELIPVLSQHEEIAEMRQSVSGVPVPIVVFLDDMDRMQKEELLVLLKILRGASSIPNVTFVCAFSPGELSKSSGLSASYLEKFFPVSVNVSTPDTEMVGRLFRMRLEARLTEQGWLKSDPERAQFKDLMENVWNEALSKICTNLRQLTLLLNDILTAASSLIDEVNPLDLTIIESVRRFYPSAYHLIRQSPAVLTYDTGRWRVGDYLSPEDKTKGREEFEKQLQGMITEAGNADVLRSLLCWLFPAYAETAINKRLYYYNLRQTNADKALSERLICRPEYFPIYFRTAIPQEVYSNTDLQHLISELNRAQTDNDAQLLFERTFDAIPPEHPKREDYLWKLSRAFDLLNDLAAERLAYAVSSRAADYRYDLMNIGEAARAIAVVFGAAQKLSKTTVAQRILEGAMARSSDDTFARRIWEFTEDRERNAILTNFGNIDGDRIKNEFMERMRRRYGLEADVDSVKLSQGEWQAFQLWVKYSEQDREAERQFWRRFINGNRKRLAQAIAFIYPPGVWEGDPTPLVNAMFPIDELKRLISELPNDRDLNETEEAEFTRINELFNGRYGTLGRLPV